MREISLALLRLPEGKIIFQRRSKDAQIAPGMLGFFGGHVESGESYAEAMNRELAEETSLDLDNVGLEHMEDYVIPVLDNEVVSFHLYQGKVSNMDFEVYEGDKAEAYTRKAALARDDLTPSARHVLTNILGDK